MQRCFTIIEGEGKGQSKPFTSSLMIVGRAQEAEIHIDDSTNKVSKLHLQVRVEADVVFVENKSQFGSLLNGKPLNGVVSLEANDVLKIGDIKLRYEEKVTEPPSAKPSARAGNSDPKLADIDATKVADSAVLAALEKGRQKEEGVEDGGTVVAADQATKMMDEKELDKWVRSPGPTAQSKSFPWVGLLLVVIVAALGGTFWFLRQKAAAASVGTIEFDDPIYSFSISYPANWTKPQFTPEATVFGFGQEGDADMARVVVFHDKNPDHAVTGLTDGFLQYVEVMKKQKEFKDFELTSPPERSPSGEAALLFWFHTSSQQGKGLFLLNAETRLVVECYCPIGSYERLRFVLGSILQSFHLSGEQAQQFIEYAMPDANMTTLASASPAELKRQLDDHMAKGADLLKNRLLLPANLSLSMQEYRLALQLSLAGPERLPSWRPAAEGLLEATKLFNEALDAQRIKIKIAQKEGERKTAYWEAQHMLQMVPDKTDPAYQEAYSTLRSMGNAPP